MKQLVITLSANAALVNAALVSVEVVLKVV